MAGHARDHLQGISIGMAAGVRTKCGSRFLDPINSVGVKVGYLVRQLADIYLNHHPVHLWDTCAPLVILEEAGGRMTHWDGTPLAYSLKGDFAHPQGTVATNGLRHDDLVKLIGEWPKP